MLKRDYGLKSSLHTPLSGWCDPSSYSPEMHRLDRCGDWCGRKSEGLTPRPCAGPRIGTSKRRHGALKCWSQNGAAYFMVDGTMCHGECWDPEHGHRVPARREEHVRSLCRLARMVHAEYRQVLIEMHDPVVGGQTFGTPRTTTGMVAPRGAKDFPRPLVLIPFGPSS